MKKTTHSSGTVSLPQNLLKKLLLSCFAMVVMFSSYAANITSTGSGNWNSTTPGAPWPGGIVPGAADNVTVANGSSISVTAATSCTIVTINSGGRLLLTGGNITIATTFTVNGSLDCGAFLVNGACNFTLGSANTDTLKIGDSNGITTSGATGSIQNTGSRSFGSNSTYVYESTSTGVTQVTGNGLPASIRNLTINRSVATDIVQPTNPITLVNMSGGGGILTLNRGIFLIGTGNTFTMNGSGNGNTINNPNPTGTSNIATTGTNGSDGGTVNFTSNNPVTINGPGLTTFFNLNASTNASVTITTPSTVLINGTVTVGTHNNPYLYFLGTNGPIYGALSNLIIKWTSSSYTQGPEWNATSGYIIGTTPGYPNNVSFSGLCCALTATFGNNKNINGVLTLGDGTSTNDNNIFGANFSCGGIIINSGEKVTGPSANMIVNGSWYRAATATYLQNGGLVSFGNGLATCSTPNTINAAAGAETFVNVAIISNANVSLSVPVTVSTIALTSGILTTTAANILKVSTTTPLGITGGSSTAYINGPVQWSLGAAAGIYNFPVGSGACTPYYLPFILNKASGATIATVQGHTPGSGGTPDATLSVLSTTEYWSFATSAALSAGSKISVARPTPVSPSDSIAQSATTAAGTYTSIGGTAVANGVNNSSPISTATSLFFTLGGPTLVTTLPATSITTTSATLNGAYNTQGTSLTTGFSYGTTTNSGLGTPISLHSGRSTTTSVPDSALITGLIANTLYTFVATDAAPQHGSDVTFVTAPNPPVVGTPTAPTYSGFTANWAAPASMGSAPYSYTVEVSTDPAFSTIAATQSGIGSGTLSNVFNSLAPGTTYYFRVRADNVTASSTWSATSTSITTLSTPTPVCNTGQSIQTSSAPVIDGTVDPSWAGVFANTISNDVVHGTHPGGPIAGFAAQWRSQWDATNLYILVQVTDPVWHPDFHGLDNHFYNYDAVEVYLSGNHNTGTAYGANDAQYGFSTATVVAGSNAFVNLGTVGSSASKTGVVYSIVASPGGYTAEIEIPWSALGVTSPSMNNIIGLDVGIDENHSTVDPDATGDVPGLDGGLYRDVQYQWHSTASDNYSNPSHFGPVPLTAPASLPDAGADQAICTNLDSAVLTATPPTVGAGNWSVLSGPSTATSQFSSLSDPAATFTPAGGTGTYTLLWNVTNNPCTYPVNAPDTVVINDNPLPVVGINTVDSVEENTQITLTGSPANPGNIATWSVSPSGTVDNVHDFVTTATPAVTSTYSLSVTDANNCNASAQKTVITTPALACKIKIPNAFTPNSDGFNDTWKITGNCYTVITVDVYNRWGSRVYHSDNYSSGSEWDGKYQGKDVADATYYYVVTAHSPTANPILKGSVTVVR